MQKVIVNICRFVVALTFIFSGFVKAIDPMGTQYKIQDYFAALELEDLMPDMLALIMSVGLSAIEFCLGIFLLFAINRRVVTRCIVVFMGIMTVITLWLWIANPVSDCGCFGDAVKLSNGQTLLKNIVLLLCSLVVASRPLLMMRFISRSNQWIVKNYSLLFIILCSVWCLYDLPLFDFRPYHIGADIRQGMQIPEGEEQPQFKTTFMMKKDGVVKEFTLDNYPDSTWTFVDSRTVQISEGYIPPIHDFSIVTVDEGADITEDIVNNSSYCFLLISPHLEKASDANFGEIDQLYQYAEQHDYPFYCLTASNQSGINQWIDITGAEYPFCQTDEITLKTIIRSNPGLLLMKDGKIIRKWNCRHLPSLETDEMAQPLEKLSFGHLPENRAAQKLIVILLWFALPLFLLTVVDRLWNLRKRRIHFKHLIGK